MPEISQADFRNPQRYEVVVKDKEQLINKLKKGFTVAFLLTDQFKLSIADNNSHVDAARAVGLPSNAAKGIVVKGRIIPKIQAIEIHNSELSAEAFLQMRLNSQQLDMLGQDVARFIINWLGPEFNNYRCIKVKKIKS